MDAADLIAGIRALQDGGTVRFSLRDLPLDELLLTLHGSRFTGRVEVGAAEYDRLYFRGGAMVGTQPSLHREDQLIGKILVQLKVLTDAQLKSVLQEATIRKDGVVLGERLLQKQLITADDLDKACAEQGRRRLFRIYEFPEAEVVVAEGIDRLAHFHPIHIDVRPAIAFGMVVRSSDGRKRAMVARVTGRKVGLTVPYDAQRNSYGFPPALLHGVKVLSSGPVTMEAEPELPGLSADETLGLLLLFDRMSLLDVE